MDSADAGAGQNSALLSASVGRLVSSLQHFTVPTSTDRPPSQSRSAEEPPLGAETKGQQAPGILTALGAMAVQAAGPRSSELRVTILSELTAALQQALPIISRPAQPTANPAHPSDLLDLPVNRIINDVPVQQLRNQDHTDAAPQSSAGGTHVTDGKQHVAFMPQARGDSTNQHVRSMLPGGSSASHLQEWLLEPLLCTLAGDVIPACSSAAPSLRHEPSALHEKPGVHLAGPAPEVEDSAETQEMLQQMASDLMSYALQSDQVRHAHLLPACTRQASIIFLHA